MRQRDAAPGEAQMQQSTVSSSRRKAGMPRHGAELARKLRTGIVGRGAYQRPPGAPPTPGQLKVMRARELFLAELRKGQTVSRAAHTSGMTAATFYRQRDTDPAFAAEWDAALEAGNDELEARIVDASAHDWRAAVRILEARRPNTWGRQAAAKATVTVNTATAPAGTIEEERRRIAELELKLLGRVVTAIDGEPLPGLEPRDI